MTTPEGYEHRIIYAEQMDSTCFPEYPEYTDEKRTLMRELCVKAILNKVEELIEIEEEYNPEHGELIMKARLIALKKKEQ